MSLYTNTPQEEGIQTICKAYAYFYHHEIPIPMPLLERALRLILQENSVQFNGKNHYLHTHGTAMGTKWQLPLPTFSWRKLKQRSLTKAR